MFTPGFCEGHIMDRGGAFDAAATTVAKYPVGTRKKDHKGREYIYSKIAASTAITAGQCCALAVAGADPLTLTNANEATYGFCPVGIAMAAASSSATAQYMWFCVYANSQALGSVLCAASVATYIHLGTTGTAGALQSVTSTGSEEVTGIILTTSQGTVAGINDTAIINYPYVSNLAHAS
jgi:hypothetical protein